MVPPVTRCTLSRTPSATASALCQCRVPQSGGVIPGTGRGAAGRAELLEAKRRELRPEPTTLPPSAARSNNWFRSKSQAATSRACGGNALAGAGIVSSTRPWRRSTTLRDSDSESGQIRGSADPRIEWGCGGNLRRAICAAPSKRFRDVRILP